MIAAGDRHFPPPSGTRGFFRYHCWIVLLPPRGQSCAVASGLPNHTRQRLLLTCIYREGNRHISHGWFCRQGEGGGLGQSRASLFMFWSLCVNKPRARHGREEFGFRGTADKRPAKKGTKPVSDKCITQFIPINGDSCFKEESPFYVQYNTVQYYVCKYCKYIRQTELFFTVFTVLCLSYQLCLSETGFGVSSELFFSRVVVTPGTPKMKDQNLHDGTFHNKLWEITRGRIVSG